MTVVNKAKMRFHNMVTSPDIWKSELLVFDAVTVSHCFAQYVILNDPGVYFGGEICHVDRAVLETRSVQ